MYNILFLTVDYVDPNKGGVQRVCYNQSLWFEMNHNVFFCSLESSGQQSNLGGRYVLPNKSDICSDENYQYLISVIEDNKIDIVLNHTYRESLLTLVCRVRGVRSFKVITTYHTSPRASLVSLRDDFDTLKFRYRSAARLCQQVYHIIKYPYSYWRRLQHVRGRLKYIYDKSDVVVLLSDNFRSDFIYLSRAKNPNLVLSIPNPLETIAYKVEPKRDQVLFVGRLIYQKRVDRLLRIWSKVYRDNPSWELLIVGDGEALTAMQQYSVEMGLRSVRFVGQASSQEYYKTAKIQCMTSSYEGFGMVLIEAQQSGCVPMAFNSFESVTDIVEDGVDGVLIAPFDEDEYARGLSWLMQNEKSRMLMEGEAQRAASRFSIERIGLEWVELFDSIIKI